MKIDHFGEEAKMIQLKTYQCNGNNLNIIEDYRKLTIFTPFHDIMLLTTKHPLILMIFIQKIFLGICG